MKWGVVVGICVLVGAVFVFNRSSVAQPIGSNDVPAVSAEDFSIVGESQKPKSEVVLSFVANKEVSELVVQRDNGGTPGDVIGSVSLPRGVYKNLIVALKEPLVIDTVVYATLYSTTDNAFDIRVNAPRIGTSGNVASTKMKVK